MYILFLNIRFVTSGDIRWRSIPSPLWAVRECIFNISVTILDISMWSPAAATQRRALVARDPLKIQRRWERLGMHTEPSQRAGSTGHGGDGMMILARVLGKWILGMESGRNRLRITFSGGICFRKFYFHY
jgi:hypothetical protein